MLAKRTMALACSMAALAGGSAVAIAATVTDDAKRAEAEVLSDAAKQLGVQSDDLRKALSDALNAQLDKAVKSGRLTREQADAIARRRAESGTVLPLGPGLHGMRRRPGMHLRGGHGRGHKMMAAAAKALGITESELHEQLHAGKTIAQVAKDENKDLADVKVAMKKAAVSELDAAVKGGRLTDAQRDEIAKSLDARIDDKVNGRFGPRMRHGRRGFGPPPGSGNAPGVLPAPAPGADSAPA